MPIVIRKIPFESVTDTKGLVKCFEDGVFEADQVVAAVGKVEGNGGVNDFSRILADRVLRDTLTAHGSRSRDEVGQVPLVWSGGCDGVIAPHMTVFADVPEGADAGSGDEMRVAVGVAMSEPILPEEIGRIPMVEKVAEGVRAAMRVAGSRIPPTCILCKPRRLS